jgi:hypothetical protein
VFHRQSLYQGSYECGSDALYDTDTQFSRGWIRQKLDVIHAVAKFVKNRRPSLD